MCYDDDDDDDAENDSLKFRDENPKMSHSFALY